MKQRLPILLWGSKLQGLRGLIRTESRKGLLKKTIKWEVTLRKENSEVKAWGQVHGEEKEDDISMEVEANNVGVKRKERIPLEEISADKENGKKQK